MKIPMQYNPQGYRPSPKSYKLAIATLARVAARFGKTIATENFVVNRPINADRIRHQLNYLLLQIRNRSGFGLRVELNKLARELNVVLEDE